MMYETVQPSKYLLLVDFVCGPDDSVEALLHDGEGLPLDGHGLHHEPSDGPHTSLVQLLHLSQHLRHHAGVVLVLRTQYRGQCTVTSVSKWLSYGNQHTLIINNN